MPPRWKKTTRSTRFSRLVADHLQPPKRGGSLVVETGFPTSLFDLVSRLRRAAEKKRRESDSHPPPSSPSGSSTNPTNLSSADSGFGESDEIVETRGDDLSSVSVASESNEIMEEEVGDAEVVDETSEEAGRAIASSNPVIMAALKLLIMVVLAMETKRFTVGITVSAFMLFLLELVARQLELVSGRLFARLRSRKLLLEPTKLKPEDKVGNFLVVPEEIPLVREDLSTEVVEIEEEGGDLKVQVLLEKELDEEAGIELRNKNTCRARMKSAMKKLVPKKLHTSKKCSSDAKGKISGGFKEEDEHRQENGVKQQSKKLQTLKKCSSDAKGKILGGIKEEDEHRQENDVKQQSQLLKKCSSDAKGKIACVFKEGVKGQHGKDVKQQSQSLKKRKTRCRSKEDKDSQQQSQLSDSKDESFCGFKEEQEMVVEVETQPLPLTLPSRTDMDQDLGMEKHGDSGYLVLCLIVLVGLVGGRILALVLALFWCLLLKKTQTRRYVKFPIS